MNNIYNVQEKFKPESFQRVIVQEIIAYGIRIATCEIAHWHVGERNSINTLDRGLANERYK
jgi:hypothetical protein